MSCLDGTLIRGEDGHWRWRDGEPEPRVRDLYAGDEFSYRCTTYGEGGTFVEVLLRDARSQPALAWVWRGVADGTYRQVMSGDHAGPLVWDGESLGRMRVEPGEDPLLGHEPILRKRAIPMVALVPIAEWDAWSRANVVGVCWSRDDEPAILARAESLGWRRP